MTQETQIGCQKWVLPSKEANLIQVLNVDDPYFKICIHFWKENTIPSRMLLKEMQTGFACWRCFQCCHLLFPRGNDDDGECACLFCPRSPMKEQDGMDRTKDSETADEFYNVEQKGSSIAFYEKLVLLPLQDCIATLPLEYLCDNLIIKNSVGFFVF